MCYLVFLLARVFKIVYDNATAIERERFWGVEAFTNTLRPRIECGGMPVGKPTPASRAKPPLA